MKENNNPWLGLKSYEENDRLYGRDKETDELSNIILNSFHTIIYGKSGIGKTSLLKAGVFPVLRYEDFYPIYIRLEHDTAQNTSYEYYLTQIENLLKQERSGIVIQYDETKKITSLSDLFDSYQFTTLKGIEQIPIFVFDQFEEIFTLNEDNNSQVSRFFKNLSEILNSNTSERNYRLVFCLREDYLYYIERYSETIPAFKRNRYSLQDLSKDEALEVITKPQKNLVDNAVAHEILQKVTSNNTDEVNATILSLYLSQLYDKMVASGATSITSNIIHQFGDDIISSFYIDNIKGISEKTIAYLEEHLVTVGGYRHNIPLEDALSAGVTQKEIEDLKKKRIINVQPSHFNVPFIEFSHDVLCPVVIKHRNDRTVKENARRIRKQFCVLATILLIVIGIILVFIYINKKQEIKNKLHEERFKAEQIENDSIKGLNTQLTKEWETSKLQQDSINYLVDILNSKNFDLQASNKNLNLKLDENKKLLLANQKLNIDLQNQIKAKDKALAKNIELNREIAEKNENLEYQLDLISAQKESLAKRNEEIKELNTVIVQRASVSGARSICEDISKAVEANDMKKLNLLNQELELFKTGLSDLLSFRSTSENGDWQNGLNGHFIFEPLFIQKYIQDHNVINESQYYSEKSQNKRGTTGATYVLMKTCVIKKGTSATWRYRVRGHNELAIVAEPLGLLTMSVHNVTNQTYYTSTNNVNKGELSRYISFDIPNKKNATIDVTITNTTNHDVSFVVISN